MLGNLHYQHQRRPHLRHRRLLSQKSLYATPFVALYAAKDLAHALLNPAPAAPFATLSTARLEAIKQLSDIFSEATTQDPPAPRQRVVPANCNVPPNVSQPRVAAPAPPQQRVSEPAVLQPRVANHRYPLRNANLISHEAVAFLTAHAKEESTQPLTNSAHSTIIFVRFGSFFCGRTEQTKRAYVAFLCFGFLSKGMTKHVFVPFAPPLSPWKRRANSFVADTYQSSFVSGLDMSSL